MEQCFCPASRSASVRPVRKTRMQRHVLPGGSGFLSPSSAARAIVRCRPPDVVVRATMRTQIPLSVRRRKASAGRLGAVRPAQPFVCPGNPRRSQSGTVRPAQAVCLTERSLTQSAWGGAPCAVIRLSVKPATQFVRGCTLRSRRQRSPARLAARQWKTGAAVRSGKSRRRLAG